MEHYIFIEPIIIVHYRTDNFDETIKHSKIPLNIIAIQNGLDIENPRYYRICKNILRKSIMQN